MLVEFSFNPDQILKVDTDDNGFTRVVVKTSDDPNVRNVATVKTQAGDTVRDHGLQSIRSMRFINVGPGGGISLG